MADSKEPEQHYTNVQSDSQGSTRIFPLYLLWFVFIPALPFFLGGSTLSFYINPTKAAHEYLDKTKTTQKDSIGKQVAVDPECNDVKTTGCVSNNIFIKKLFTSKTEFIENPQKILTHISNLLTYLSITAVHGIACLIVIGFFLYHIHKLPNPLIIRAYLYMTITTIAFFIVVYLVHRSANDIMLTQLGYKSICILLSQADLQTSLIWLDPDGGHTGEACFRNENTRLVWLAYMPIMLGILVVVMTSAFTTVMASEPIPSDDERWRPYFLARVKLLQKSFYLASLVLVTSTITILQFTSLPIELFDSTNTLLTVFSKFVDGITAFWGGMFTATLFATFVPAVILLVNQTRTHQHDLTASTDLGTWLYETVFVSIKKQIMNALVIIAPMLVGPFSALLKNLSGLSG